MTFAVQAQAQPGVTSRDATVYVLQDGAGAEARLWPALGFNCYHWQVPCQGKAVSLLYADPGLFGDGKPTRSGIPVLFPFPNRIRDGRFSWAGSSFQLPLNDPAGKNAIHGFACRSAWRVVGQGADSESAWVTGAWRCSIDEPDCRALWPADQEMELTVRLGAGSLRLEAEVRNPDRVPLPFGLGYHPYFTPPAQPDGTVYVPARSFWELDESLPTGAKRPVTGDCDLNQPRCFDAFHLDDVLTDLPTQASQARAILKGAGVELRLFWSEDFRDAVVFTPPHRHAFCVEPYTCATDAINLQAQGVDAGWRELPPGGTWSAWVEMRV